MLLRGEHSKEVEIDAFLVPYTSAILLKPVFLVKISNYYYYYYYY